MRPLEVTDKRTIKEFIDLPRTLYNEDPCWICPPDNDIAAIFDPLRNHFFKHGDCIRYILVDDSSKTIGRISAFINNEKAYKNPQPTGGVGFFECINDRAAAHVLLDKGREWLQAK